MLTHTRSYGNICPNIISMHQRDQGKNDLKWTIRFKNVIAKKAFSNLTSLETISLKEIGAFWILEFLERHRIIIRIIPDYDVENFHFSKSKLFTLCIFYSIQRNKPCNLDFLSKLTTGKNSFLDERIAPLQKNSTPLRKIFSFTRRCALSKPYQSWPRTLV